jgi:hypothetical protein
MRSQRPRSSAFGFVVLWIVATLIAFFLGTYVSILLRQTVVLGTVDTVPPASIMYLALTPPGYWGPATIISLSFVSGLIQFGFLGFGQWVILRRRVEISSWWVLLTGIGAAIVSPPFAYWRSIALSSGSAAFQNTTFGIANGWWFFLLAAATIPLAVSSLQWLVLRRHLVHAGWWLPAWVTAGAISFVSQTLLNLPYAQWHHALLMSPLARTIGVPAVTRIEYAISEVGSMLVLQVLLAIVLAILLNSQTVDPVRHDSALSASAPDTSFA